MAPEATLPPGDVNVPGDYFSLAGFEVNLYGRFWLTPEVVSQRVPKITLHCRIVLGSCALLKHQARK